MRVKNLQMCIAVWIVPVVWIVTEYWSRLTQVLAAVAVMYLVS